MNPTGNIFYWQAFSIGATLQTIHNAPAEEQEYFDAYLDTKVMPMAYPIEPMNEVEIEES